MTTWLVAQLGARMHYAVPRIFDSAGALETLYTDISAARSFRHFSSAFAPAPLRRLAGRVPGGIPPSRVRSFPALGVAYAARRAAARTPSALTAAHLWAGSTFCNAVAGRGFGQAGGVYTFNSAGLEILRRARDLGLTAVVEQTIAPAPVEDALLESEHAAFPDWGPPLTADSNRAAFHERVRAEWDCADLVVCASSFVRDGIASCNGPSERTAAVPYGVDAPLAPRLRSLGGPPLRILTAGAACLRKGTPYLLEAARALRGAAVFRLAGSIGISAEAERRLRTSVELVGPVPRAGMAEQYAWADAFLLPSLCEGSATVCYEALAAGLPVITTPNTGSVVRDGIDGFIVPIRSGEAIAAAIERVLLRRGLLAELSRNAARRAAEFTVEKYGERLLAALAGVPEGVEVTC
jgi:glycosyltransferase involved in cell wall biosynthesis